MRECPQCGQANNDDARFCVRCGSSLQAPAEAAPPPPPQAQAAPPPPPQAQAPAAAASAPTPQQPYPAQQPYSTQQSYPAQPSPPYGQQAYQYQQQAAVPPGPPVGYPQQPAAAAPAAHPRPASGTRRGGMFWVGTLILLVAGALILASTWMAWGTGSRGLMSLSGWDWFDKGKQGGGGEGEVVNAFFIYSNGRPLFTGLCSLILGALIALIALLMLIFQSRGLGGVAILFSIFALGIAITNLTTILRSDDVSVGVGTIILIAFSFLGLVGGGMAMSG